ncbi:hypothetical protein [Rhizobium sp. 007]|uniref:hypothetical protein n=1 Tax=Rhizobium sp. 007 TaxID=2785056 RepID=UPI001FF039B1|nr:hypothetical protein [Rhizobium sp. 007]
MVDIDEIKHDQEGVIGRKENRMLAVFIGVVKMNDRELRLAKRPDRQRPRCLDTKTCRNSLTGRQRFTHMCLDHPGWGLYSRPLKCHALKVPIHLSNVYLEQKHPRRRDSATYQKSARKA